MVEIEIGVRNRQYLNQRISTSTELADHLSGWQSKRNDEGATEHWTFDGDRARQKLARAYPDINPP